MNVITADQSISEKYNGTESSIFLAGPTPRKDSTPSWRPEALAILKRLGFKGTVFVPERSDWKTLTHYEDQTEWEYEGLHESSRIVFWVPRAFPDMMALTTNVEFGFWMARDPRLVIYGRPEEAEKCRYLDWMYKKQARRNPLLTLEETLIQTVKEL